MTSPNPFTPTGGGGTAGAGYLDIRIRQGNPMIVRVWDNPEYVRTSNNPDGMVYIRDKDAFPNRCVRAAIVDLNAQAPDGSFGILYPESWIQASSLMKEAKKWIDRGVKLVRWDQTGPRDGFGAPDKSAPYEVKDLSGDQSVVAQAMAWMAAHPEWDALQAPAPYDGKPPAPKVPQTPADPWALQQPQQPFYGQQQPGYYSQQPPPPPQQWQPPVPPQQPPQQWNTAAPPPEYYSQQPQWAQQQQAPPQHPQPGYNAPQIQQYMNQMPPQQPQGPYGQPPAQQGPPPQQYQQQPPQQAPQGAPGSFFAAAQGQPTPNAPQWQGGFNSQSDEPPF